MNRPAGDLDFSCAAEIHVAQIGCKQEVVGADRGTQKQRLAATQKQLEPGEMPGPMVKDSLFTKTRLDYVTVAIEGCKGGSELEHTGALIGSR